jgi:hypothetical protein
MPKEMTMVELYTAILIAKRNMRSPSKNRKAMYGKYADLESVLASVEGPLAEEGVIILQTCQEIETRLYLRTSLVHAGTGQAIHNDLPILMKNPNNPQELGGAITYARRYGIISILSIVADDDDDGNTAAGKLADGSPKPPQKASEAAKKPALTSEPAKEIKSEFVPPENSAADLLTEKMVQALIAEFKRAGYSNQEMMRQLDRITGRDSSNLYDLTQAEGRAAIAWVRKNPKE